MSALMQFLYRARWVVFRAINRQTRGAKLMLFNPAGELLLVRNSYGRTSEFILPGGGVKRGETPQAAAIREAREEAGVEAHGVTLVSTHFTIAEGWRDTIHLFRGQTGDVPVPDGREVIEARFFALDALPASLSPATARRIAEMRGEREPDGSW